MEYNNNSELVEAVFTAAEETVDGVEAITDGLEIAVDGLEVVSEVSDVKENMGFLDKLKSMFSNIFSFFTKGKNTSLLGMVKGWLGKLNTGFKGCVEATKEVFGMIGSDGIIVAATEGIKRVKNFVLRNVKGIVLTGIIALAANMLTKSKKSSTVEKMSDNPQAGDGYEIYVPIH